MVVEETAPKKGNRQGRQPKGGQGNRGQPKGRREQDEATKKLSKDIKAFLILS